MHASSALPRCWAWAAWPDWGLGQWQAGHAPHPTAQPQPQAAASAGERKVLYWYDPMVPTQQFDKPGKSPFMDMQLVPRYADEGGLEPAPAHRR